MQRRRRLAGFLILVSTIAIAYHSQQSFFVPAQAAGRVALVPARLRQSPPELAALTTPFAGVPGGAGRRDRASYGFCVATSCVSDDGRAVSALQQRAGLFTFLI